MLEDISDICALPTLMNLDCSHTTALSDISSLTEAVMLRSVALKDCGSLTDLRALSALTGLTYVDLSGSAVTDITPLAGLHRLKGLSLHRMPALTDFSSCEAHRERGVQVHL